MASEILAELFKPGVARGFVTALGKVTSVTPLRVLLDSAEEDIGPLQYIRGKPKQDEKVLLLRKDDTWIVVGKKSRPFSGDIGVTFLTVNSGDDDQNIEAMFRINGVWTPRVLYHTIPHSIFGPDIDSIGTASMSEDSSVIGITTIRDWVQNQPLPFLEPFLQHHIFPMSDGADLALFFVRNNDVGENLATGFYAFIKPPGSETWTPHLVTTTFGEANQFSRKGDEDILYGWVADIGYVAKIEYTGGSIVSSVLDVSTLVADGGFDSPPYIDLENGLFHVMLSRGFPSEDFFLTAFRLSDLSFAYELNWVSDWGGTPMGNGDKNFIVATLDEGVDELFIHRLEAGPSSYTSGPTPETFPPFDASGTSSVQVHYTGREEITIGKFVSNPPGNGHLYDFYLLARNGPDDYDPWELFTEDVLVTPVGPAYQHGVTPNFLLGEVIRVAFTRVNTVTVQNVTIAP